MTRRSYRQVEPSLGWQTLPSFDRPRPLVAVAMRWMPRIAWAAIGAVLARIVGG